MNVDRIPPRSPEGHVLVLVEIPKGGQNKYEYDHELGVIALDRALYSAVHYPTDYGFVPGTRSQDGELLDCLVVVEQPTFPGCLVRVRLIGVLTITHSSGQPESKLLGVPVREPRLNRIKDIEDLGEEFLKEIEQFFGVYKELQGSEIGVLGWEDAAHANQVLDEAIRQIHREPRTRSTWIE
jgi:inorganic pyrophosphatase